MKFNYRLIFWTLSGAAWVVMLFWAFYPLPAPIVWYAEGESVEPTVVSKGGEITVTRDYEVASDRPVFILRTLIKGDCKKRCEIVDLPSSVISLSPGERRKQTRDFILPDAVEKGIWQVVFVAQWTDALGRVSTQRLNVLSFTVL